MFRRSPTPRFAWLALLVAAMAWPALAADWPSFRGPGASGVADGLDLPERWDGTTGENVRWKTPIPGLAHSSPVVWGDRVFVTTAVSSRADADFKEGLYGEGTASADRSEQRWLLLALDLATGRVVWEREAHRGVPRDKRHIKATYANSTPATDGRVVVAFFGSEGVFGYSVDGDRLWHRDLGRLDAGAYDVPDYEWGSASSPILWNGMVILQCDTQGEDFLIALDAATGETVWRTGRDELPSWGTPTVYPHPERPELVTNGANFIRGYDPASGRELWRLGGSSKITAPTPVYSGELIVVASGRRPEKPLFVLRRGARGDITLPEGATSSSFVLWRSEGRGSYMPTPLIYGDYLYVCANNGVLGCYRLRTGEEAYYERISHRGAGFSASPVAADGRIYLPSEDGEVFVVAAGPEFRLLATYPMGERLMATPALAGTRGGGLMLVRGRHHLFAVGRATAEQAGAGDAD